MSEVSEAAFFAGWMNGLEFELWDALQSGPRNYGQIVLTEEVIQRLRELSVRCGGWVAWDGDEEVFVPLSLWTEVFRNWDR
jgi:hypothetical protein